MVATHSVDRSREGCQYNSNPDDRRTQRLITYGSRILSIVVKPGICLSPPDAQPTTVGERGVLNDALGLQGNLRSHVRR